MTSQTNPQTVREAHLAAFTGKMNLIHCANHCGMTVREFKMTFWEFLKYNPPTYSGSQYTQLSIDI